MYSMCLNIFFINHILKVIIKYETVFDICKERVFARTA